MNPMEKQLSVIRPASKSRFPIGRNIAGGSSAESGQYQELTPLRKMNHLFDFDVSLQCASNAVEPAVLANALQIIPKRSWDNTKRPLSEQRSTRSREWRYYACFGFKNDENLNYEEFIDSVFDRLDGATDLLNSIAHPNGRLDLYTTVYSVEAFAIVLPRDLLRRAGKIGVAWGIEYLLLDRKRP